MISYSAYKVIHLTGIFLLLMSVGGLLFQRLNGGELTRPAKRRAAIGHGIGIFITLIAGFAMLGKLGIRSAMPGWVWMKFAIWVYFATSLTLALKKPKLAPLLWWLSLLLAAFAAYLGINHTAL
jgi:hypothetical protein